MAKQRGCYVALHLSMLDTLVGYVAHDGLELFIYSVTALGKSYRVLTLFESRRVKKVSRREGTANCSVSRVLHYHDFGRN